MARTTLAAESGGELVTIDLEPAAYGCDLTLTQTGELPEATEHDWRKMLDSLALMCAEPS